MATPDQLTILRRAADIVARQAPATSIDASLALLQALDDDDIADRFIDALDDSYAYAARVRRAQGQFS